MVTRRLARSEWRVRFPPTAPISALPTGNGHFENRIVDMRRASSRYFARAPCAPGRLVRQQILNLLKVGSIPTARTRCRCRSVVSSRLLTGWGQVRLLPAALRAVGLVAWAPVFQTGEASSILAPHSAIVPVGRGGKTAFEAVDDGSSPSAGAASHSGALGRAALTLNQSREGSIPSARTNRFVLPA